MYKFLIKEYEKWIDYNSGDVQQPQVVYFNDTNQVKFESYCSFNDKYDFSIGDEEIDIVNNGKPTTFQVDVTSLKNGKYQDYSVEITNGASWLTIDMIDHTYATISVKQNTKSGPEEVAIVTFKQNRNGEIVKL